MVEQAAITKAIQIGVETTPGTAVAAGKRLQSLNIDLEPDGNIEVFRPTGSKFAAVTAIGKEWTGLSIDGTPTYPELPYVFSSLFGTPVITTDGTSGHRYAWDVDPFAPDTVKTLTIQKGDSNRAWRVAYGLIGELGFEFTRESISVDGSGIARNIEDGITMTASPTSLDLVPVLPKEVSVYLDDVAADFGTTKLLRALMASFTLGGDRFMGVWPLDAAQASFAAHVEGDPDAEASLRLATDAAGMALLPVMRDGSSKFLRIQAIGPVIAGATPSAYELTIDLSVKVSDMLSFSDEDGLYAVEWPFEIVTDPTWGKALHVEIVTTAATL
jgi:hypothetical protein